MAYRSPFGPKIVRGDAGAPVLRYVSPSCLKTFDPRVYGGCPRKWAFRYIAKIRPPASKAQQTGTDGHERIEHHLLTGEDTLGDFERPGRHWIPKPGSNILVEQAALPGVSAPVVEDVSIVSKIDVLNMSNYYVDTQGEPHVEDFPEVIDWKFSSDPIKWGMSADQIRDDVAMSVYGVWGIRHLQQNPGGFEWDLSRVRLSHVYFGTRRREAYKRTAIVPVDRLLAKLRNTAPVIREIKKVVATTTKETVGQIECNLDACTAYRGCEYQDICDRPVSTGDAVNLMLGITPDGANNMTSILDSLNDAPTEPPKDSANLTGLMERLKKACQSLQAGFPNFDGAALARIVELKIARPGPAGKLAGSTITDVESFAKAVNDLESRAAQVAATPTAPPAPAVPSLPDAINPPNAVNDPEKAAVPLPPEEVIALEPLVREAVENHPAQNAAPPAENKPGRPASPDSHLKKMKKPELVAHALELEQKLERAGQDAQTPDATLQLEVDRLRAELAAARENQGIGTSPGITLYVDAVAEGATPLDSYVDKIAADIVSKAPGAAHLLAAPNDSPLAYGKWRGLVVAYVRNNPPPAGVYYLLARGDEVRECFAEAVRPLAAVFVRGVR